MMPEPGTLTVTVPEYAKAVGVGESTIYAAIQRVEIPAVKVGRSVRLPRWLLDKLKEPPASAIDDGDPHLVEAVE
jgi:excisionase family DNA binding protein